jgi:hypothetical protein
MVGAMSGANYGAPAPEPARYLVGNCKPPVEHRFKKGQSGNPAGRPRATGKPGDRLRGSDEPTRAMILEEAYRTVPVTIGDAVVEMPMNQAVFRSLGMVALTGNLTALRRWTELVRMAEAEQKQAQVAIHNAFERDGQHEELEHRRRNDEDMGEFYHQDILYDRRTGNTVILGEDLAGEGDEAADGR